MKRTLLIIKLKIAHLLSTIVKIILGKHALALVVKTRQGIFCVDPMDRGVGRDLLLHGNYGDDVLAGLHPYMSRDHSVLIVGAHIGTLTIPIARQCKKVIAIEPNPSSYELLMLNLAMNKITNCEVVNLAAGDKNERLDFLVSRSNSGGSKRVPKVKHAIYYSDNPQVISVDSVPLDEYLGEQAFDLIIMDIEGSEFFALKGMPNILSMSKAIQVEFLTHHLKNVSGVTVEQFLGVIAPYFSNLYIPSKQLNIKKDDFTEVLTEMYKNDEEDDGIIFYNCELL